MFQGGPNCLEAHECRGDFWLKLEEAMRECGGGGSIESISKKKLIDVVNILAQNGIRMVYNKDWHINNFLNK